VLRYDDVRTLPDPRSAALEFYESACQAGGRRAGWEVERYACPEGITDPDTSDPRVGHRPPPRRHRRQRALKHCLPHTSAGLGAGRNDPTGTTTPTSTPAAGRRPSPASTEIIAHDRDEDMGFGL